jgi:hypothetical protein
VNTERDEQEIEKAVEALSRGEDYGDLPVEDHEHKNEDKVLDRRTSKGATGDDTLEWITSLLK